MQETPGSWVGKIPWRRDRLPTLVFMGFPGGSESKEFGHNVGDLGLISGFERDPRRRHGNPLQYSGLEYPHGQRSLVGYNPWGCKELDMTEQLNWTERCLYYIFFYYLSWQTYPHAHLTRTQESSCLYGTQFYDFTFEMTEREEAATSDAPDLFQPFSWPQTFLPMHSPSRIWYLITQ